MMKQSKSDSVLSSSRLSFLRVVIVALFFYLILMSFGIPFVFTGSVSNEFLSLHEQEQKGNSLHQNSKGQLQEFKKVSGLLFNESLFDGFNGKNEFSKLHKVAKDAWVLGKKLWEELQTGNIKVNMSESPGNSPPSCSQSVFLSGDEFKNQNMIMMLPCGLTFGSHITVVGVPRWAHVENDPKISELKKGEKSVMVSQFMMELQGLKVVDGEEPPRILHFNMRLKGDWSESPVIELNSCYRMQWGNALRCEGWESWADEETVDGQLKCEKWNHDDDNHSEKSETAWRSRMIGRTKKATLNWPYPFAEGKLFVLTLQAGFEGYHISVEGRHVTSFPYRLGFLLEDATGLLLKGGVDVHSVYAASLPMTHPSVASQEQLDMLSVWKAPPLRHGHTELFIGILSAGNHFAERMAVRKSWMQHKFIKSSKVVARFFVALNGRKEVNVELKKEAEYFGDIVIVPYMDHYDLVVLKTIAICEYGIRTTNAKYIMKCDDDTFVRFDAVIKELKTIQRDKSVYIGNINYYHWPLRYGKWAVTYEEWPEEDYPPYANGPGYIVSSDIAEFVVSRFENKKLRLFKMEDVSMGMWVGQFNKSRPVEYIHNLKFCQFGCIDGYYTAHYQSPRQMICMWEKLQLGKPHCCDKR